MIKNLFEIGSKNGRPFRDVPAILQRYPEGDGISCKCRQEGVVSEDLVDEVAVSTISRAQRRTLPSCVLSAQPSELILRSYVCT